MRIENEILMHFRAAKKTSFEISLSEPIDTDKDGNPLELIDIISKEDDTADLVQQRENFRIIHKMLKERLSEREREIIVMRYGIDNALPLTQREIAKKLKISRSYVSRIEKKALEKMREGFKP